MLLDEPAEMGLVFKLEFMGDLRDGLVCGAQLHFAFEQEDIIDEIPG
jgi:hypothetical protein